METALALQSEQEKDAPMCTLDLKGLVALETAHVHCFPPGLAAVTHSAARTTISIIGFQSTDSLKTSGSSYVKEGWQAARTGWVFGHQEDFSWGETISEGTRSRL